jgi:tetratricopeptide (TPR) repeat protein
MLLRGGNVAPEDVSRHEWPVGLWQGPGLDRLFCVNKREEAHTVRILPIVALCGVVCWGSHRRLRDAAHQLPSSLIETLPSLRALDLLSLGYQNLLADYYWVRSLDEFGDSALHEHHYPNLAPYLERVVHLDPLFAGAYIFVGNALGFQGMDINLAIKLLKKGVHHRPDKWKIPFLLGFHLYDRRQDYIAAIKALKKAASLPGSPTHLPHLITRMSAHAGQPEVGLEFIERLIESTDDPKLKNDYIERRKLLLVEFHIKHLNAALKAYTKKRGAAASSLKQLVEIGFVNALPEEPFGGSWTLDAKGQATTTSDIERLKLHGAPPQKHIPSKAKAPLESPPKAPAQAPTLAQPTSQKMPRPPPTSKALESP